MSWAKIKEKQAIGGQGMGKAFQLSKALAAMGYTSWNRLEPGDYMIDIISFPRVFQKIRCTCVNKKSLNSPNTNLLFYLVHIILRFFSVTQLYTNIKTIKYFN